jgi:hypothetical protein
MRVFVCMCVCVYVCVCVLCFLHRIRYHAFWLVAILSVFMLLWQRVENLPIRDPHGQCAELDAVAGSSAVTVTTSLLAAPVASR